MKKRLGALLCLALGGILIFNGVSSGAGVTVGAVAPDCGTVLIGAVVPTCPTGTIEFSETTKVAAQAAATQHTVIAAPADWSVHVTSPCNDPLTNAPVDMTVSVPNGGNASTKALFIWSNPNHNTECTYTYSEKAVAGFTATFDPASPQTITFTPGAPSLLAVTLTNVAAAPSSSPPPSSAVPTVAPSTPVAVASSSAVLSATGPRAQVRASLVIGIGLCLLGLALLFGGILPRRRGRRAG